MRVYLVPLLLAFEPSAAFFNGNDDNGGTNNNGGFNLPFMFFSNNNNNDPAPSPTKPPTSSPTANPTVNRTPSPTADPTPSPTPQPTAAGNPEPTATKFPTPEPTPSPTESPTSAATDGGQLDTPTESPTSSASDVPSGTTTIAPSDSPSAPPTVASSDSPSGTPSVASSDSPSDTPTIASSDAPSSTPSAASSGLPTATPSIAATGAPITSTAVPTSIARTDGDISSDQLPVVLTETRTSSHRYEWGSSFEGCDHEHPPVYLSCGGGGVLTNVVPSEAACELLALDRVECKSTHSGNSDTGAYVDFQCSGVSNLHLTATAEVFPSTGKNCRKEYPDNGNGVVPVGGTAAIFGVLGRFCTTTDGASVLEEIYGCTKGKKGNQGNVSYCAAGGRCTVNQIQNNGAVCDAAVGALEMSNSDDRLACSEVETNLDLIGHYFIPTEIGSYHSVEWTFSGTGLGCQVELSDVVFTCSAGGVAKLGGEAPSCMENGSSITCTNPNPLSSEQRESVFIKVWCYGDSYDKLELSADIAGIQDNSSFCKTEGMAVQGLRIRKGCPNDELISSPNFCSDPNQLYAPTNLCYAGYFCSQIECDGQTIEVPPVSVVISDPETRECVRAA